MNKTKLKQKKIQITLSEKEIDAIEDQFFCKLTERQYKKIKPNLLNIWEKLCDAMDEEIEK
ncbi:MAG TPA: hypothetical protein ENH20_00300 [Candidatus Pacearchaeota archaeon]|nr:hypothetical protein [Candidatus Pacearchaeota archaeon]